MTSRFPSLPSPYLHPTNPLTPNFNEIKVMHEILFLLQSCCPGNDAILSNKINVGTRNADYVEVSAKPHSECMPDKIIKNTFSLMTCHWKKLKWDQSFIVGAPEREFKKSWIKIGRMKDVFCKRKTIVIDMIDSTCRKDGSSREHVAHELDVLMVENDSTVTKMWKNWRRTGRFFPDLNEVAETEIVTGIDAFVSIFG